MEPNDQQSGIESLKQRLYSRVNAPKSRIRRVLHDEAYSVSSNWQHADAAGTPVVERRAARVNAPPDKLVRFIFVGSIAFFALSIGVAVLMFFTGGNTVSAENIEIDIVGPLAVAGGSPLSLQIEVTNKNGVAIKLADLIVEYPEGTRDIEDLNQSLPRLREQLGTIEPGGTAKVTAEALLFGNEDTAKQIMVTVEYRVDGSNAIFYKEKPYTVILSSAPLAIGVLMDKEISTGQELSMEVTVVSNSTEILKNVIVEAEYPFGFQFARADLAPNFDNNTWIIGDMPPGDTRTFTIRGTMTGQNNDERVFRFIGGSGREDGDREIAATYETVEMPVAIRAPFIGVRLAANGNTSNAPLVAGRGELVRVDIEWGNNTQSPIYDIEIEAKLAGNVLDRNSIEARGGFYRSIDNTILFTRETDTSLAEARPGTRGTVGFSFASSKLASDPTLPTPEISMVVNVRAKRLNETNVPEELTTSAQKKVVLGTSAVLASKSVYREGPFQNTGPVPPKVEEETTYTVVLTVTNSTSEIKDARVEASLPSYVTFKNAVSPSGAKLSYNPAGGIVVWDIGTIPARAGFEGPAKEVAFQVSVVPSLSQVGETIPLVREQKFSGLDTYTKTMVETTRTAITTRTSDMGSNAGAVVR